MDNALFEGLKSDLAAHFTKSEQRAQAMQDQLDAIDLKVNAAKLGAGAGASEFKSAGEQFITGDEFKAAAEARFGGKYAKRTIAYEVKEPFAGRKSVIANWTLGNGTSGVLMPTRLPGVTGLAQQRLRIRDLMTVRPMTSGNAFDWIKQTLRSNGASPQQESSPKAESTYGWTAEADRVRTIAHFTHTTRQTLDDNAWLRGQIDGELMYGLLLKEESEILSGDGAGEHLNGIITQATSRATTWDVSGDTRLDRLRKAKLQVRLAGGDTFAPDAIVLNPVDMMYIETIKTEEGAANKGVYVVGDPSRGGAITFVWGLPVVESDSITAGNFLIGAFGTAVELIDRATATVEVSYEHGENFTKNMATLLCEERIGLAVRRPDAFVYGAF
jgi:HK97 family phage major capsid protein